MLAAGPHVSIQDGWRAGFMRFGVPASGPMDRDAFAIANAALGNPAGSPGIEISTGGLTPDCLSGELILAVAGRGFILQAGNRRLGSWTVLTLRAGQQLALRPGFWGSWDLSGLRRAAGGGGMAGQRVHPCAFGSWWGQACGRADADGPGCGTARRPDGTHSLSGLGAAAPGPACRAGPAVLQQDFASSGPNQKWAGDITYVWDA